MFFSFTTGRNPCGSLTLTGRPLMLSHERRLYLHLDSFQDAVFFFHHWLVALLSLKEIVVEGLPYRICDLGLSLLNIHCLQHLAPNGSCVSWLSVHRPCIGFYLSLCHPYCFFRFHTVPSAVSGSVLVVRL